MDNEVYIEKSNFKILLMLIGAILFVIGGFLIILGPPSDSKPLIVIIIGGYGGIIFFGYGTYVLIRQLLSSKVGIKINNSGFIFDNTHPNDCFLKWDEIEQIETIYVRKQKILNIYLTDPEAFIDRQENKLKKRIMRFNLDNYGTPVSISTNGLKIKHDQLKAILQTWIQKNKSTKA
jgi:hypothetical protein